MSKNRKVGELLKTLMTWPFYLGTLLIVMTVWLFFIDGAAGCVASIFVLVYAGSMAVMFFVRKNQIYEQLIHFGQNFGQVQKSQLKQLAVPYAIVDAEGKLLFTNDEFLTLFGDAVKLNNPVSELIPKINQDMMPVGNETVSVHIKVAGSSYRADVKNMTVEPEDWSRELGPERPDHIITAIYLYDETENMILKQYLEERQLVVGLLYIDNYEEALESIDEVRRSLLVALIDRKINKYFQNVDALLKKLEKDKFMFVFQKKYLGELKNAKFTILDEVREVNIGNEMAVTVSIGIGNGFNSYTEGYEAARAAMDLALGRGGDQVVIKSSDNIDYYGGKSNSVEKSTRVKARVKAQSLGELIVARDKVVIMGHKMADADSFGSAVGVYSIAKHFGKKAWIVMDEVNASIKALVDRFSSNQDYAELIIDKAEAMTKMDASTVLVVVDVNRPAITECPELLDLARYKVLIDHHRQTSDSIMDAVLSYVEPNASSACEMVSEILQYIGNGLKIKGPEADSLYAGIMVDTNNFMTKTGVRTYEAAAYLKRNGADIVRIRKLFRTDIKEYMVKARAAGNAECYLDEFLLTECNAEGCASPTVLGAQVANELMDINGVKASFAFTMYNEQVFVSARSIDEVNVQVVMERLGGGGHMSVAGAQFSDCSVEEAKQRVRDVLKSMREGGEI